MSRLLLAAALLVGCHRSTPREDDCATVQSVLERHTVHRRNHDDGETPRADDKLTIYDMDALRALQSHAYRDPEITAAVKAVGDTGWTIYTPYSTDHESAIDKLAALCHLPRQHVSGVR